jgi:hypothetical protein
MRIYENDDAMMMMMMINAMIYELKWMEEKERFVLPALLTINK